MADGRTGPAGATDRGRDAERSAPQGVVERADDGLGVLDADREADKIRVETGGAQGCPALLRRDLLEMREPQEGREQGEAEAEAGPLGQRDAVVEAGEVAAEREGDERAGARGAARA